MVYKRLVWISVIQIETWNAVSATQVSSLSSYLRNISVSPGGGNSFRKEFSPNSLEVKLQLEQKTEHFLICGSSGKGWEIRQSSKYDIAFFCGLEMTSWWTVFLQQPEALSCQREEWEQEMLGLEWRICHLRLWLLTHTLSFPALALFLFEAGFLGLRVFVSALLEHFPWCNQRCECSFKFYLKLLRLQIHLINELLNENCHCFIVTTISCENWGSRQDFTSYICMYANLKSEQLLMEEFNSP